MYTSGRINHQLAAGQTFAEIVVAVALQFQSQTLRDKGSEALSARALTFYRKSILFQAFRIPLGDLRTKHGAESTIRIAHIQLDAALGAIFQGREQLLEQNLLIQGLLQFEVVDQLRIKDNLLALTCERVVQDVA